MRSSGACTLSGLALLALAACEGAGPQMGQLNVRLTDAPLAHLASATVRISRVYLIGGADESGARFTISDTPQEFDLLTLQNGVTAALGSASIPVGDYTQMRLVVDEATVTLAPGLTFSDGSTSRTLKTPSGTESGIKVNFAGPVHVAPGQTDLVVDFDVSRNFVFTGNPSQPNGVLFKPVLHASVMDVAGSIAGTSLPLSANGQLFAITGKDTVTSTLADATTGAYKLSFLPPGTYTVADSAVGYVTTTQSVTVGPAQNVTGVNFTLPVTPQP